MNILFLIGNGFDINLGLNTSFSKVLDDYIKEGNYDEKSANFVKELKENKVQWWSDFEYQLGQYTTKFDKNNYNDLLSQKHYFSEFLIKKFKTEEDRIDEIKLKKEISSVFMKHLLGFHTHLPDKNRKIILDFIKKDTSNSNLQFNFIIFNYTTIMDKIITFAKSYFNIPYNGNFEGVPEKFVKCEFAKIIHIHGTLDKHFIMGVDNFLQIANPDLSGDDNFISTYVKPYTNEKLGRSCTDDSKELINKSSIICIFGMSIGLTDKTWWINILHWLRGGVNRHFIIFYHKPGFSILFPETVFNISDEAMNNFIKASCREKDTIEKDRIHIIVDNVDMFKLDILKDHSGGYTG
jgi:hypothetical protein